MALIKKFVGNEIGSTSASYFIAGSSATNTNYVTFLEGANYALVEDPHENVLYFSNSSNDSYTLVPNYDRELDFKNVFKSNLRHGFSSSLLFTSRPTMKARFNFTDIENDEEIYTSQISNRTFKNNLDLEDVYLGGNFQTHQVADKTYTFLSLPDQNNSTDASSTYNTSPSSSVYIIEGNDYSSCNYITYDNPDRSLEILHVDTTNQIIYLGAVHDNVYGTVASERMFNQYAAEGLYALPYKTVETDGVFEFEPLVNLIYDTNTFSNSAREGAIITISYMGQAADNADCFMLVHNSASKLTATGLTETQLGIDFLKINPNQVRSSTTTFSLNNEYTALDCFQHYLVSLNADVNTASDYSPTQYNVTPSKGYNFDPAAPNDYWYYLPYFSNANVLKLLAIEWDKSSPTWDSNAFTLHENLTSSLTSTDLGNPQPEIAALQNYGAAYEAHYSVYLTSNNRLHFTFNHIDYALYADVTQGSLTKTLSLSVDTTSPQTLTLETTSTIPSLNSLLLKNYDDGTFSEIAVLTPTGCNYYVYNPTNGWTLANSEPGTFSEFTTDSLQRRWAFKAPINGVYNEVASEGYFYSRLHNCELHLISQVLPYTTSVEFANTDVTYAGITIQNTLVINAFDSAGARVEKDVTLTIQGSNMVFDEQTQATQQTVTTSTNSDTSVSVYITGPGYVNVSASFVV